MTGKPSSKPICSSSLKPSMSAAQRSQNGSSLRLRITI